MGRARFFALLFVAGGVGISALDHLHVAAGTTSYSDPTAFGQPWWVLPQMGLATVLGVAGSRLFVRGQAPRPHEVPWRVALFAAAYATSALLWRNSLTVLAVLGAAWVAVIVLGREPPGTIVSCVLLALVGTGYEMALVAAGVFEYARPEVVGVQWWLPTLYLVAGLLGVSLARAVPGSQPAPDVEPAGSRSS